MNNISLMLIRQPKAVFLILKRCFTAHYILKKFFEYRMIIYLLLEIFSILNSNSELEKFRDPSWIIVPSLLNYVTVSKISLRLYCLSSGDNIGHILMRITCGPHTVDPQWMLSTYSFLINCNIENLLDFHKEVTYNLI